MRRQSASPLLFAAMPHIYFDDGAGPSTSAAAAAAGTKFAHCCSRARVSYNDADPCYVFKAIRSPDSSGVAASLSNHSIKLYSCGAAGLSHTGDIAAHQDTISDIQFSPHADPNTLYSCSRDGFLKIWDLRTNQLVHSYHALQELYSFAVLENFVAVGGAGFLQFWERRYHTGGGYWADSHMDDVTQILFHGGSKKLVTASQDGLVAVHDVSRGLSEEDSFLAALNAGTSVEQLGFYGSQGQHMWCRTGTETLQLWDWLAATVEDAAGGNAPVADLTEARQLAAAAASSSPAAACMPEVDYLISCHYDAASGQLLLVAGTNSGAAAFFPIAEQQHRAGQLPPGANILQPPAVVLNGCHREIVRSVDCFDPSLPQRLLCVTAGEDAQLGLWTLDQAATAAAAAATSSKDSGDSSGPQKRHQQQPAGLRRSPY